MPDLCRHMLSILWKMFPEARKENSPSDEVELERRQYREARCRQGHEATNSWAPHLMHWRSRRKLFQELELVACSGSQLRVEAHRETSRTTLPVDCRLLLLLRLLMMLTRGAIWWGSPWAMR